MTDFPPSAVGYTVMGRNPDSPVKVEIWEGLNIPKRARITINGEVRFIGSSEMDSVDQFSHLDSVFLSIIKGQIDHEALRLLPVWRAVLLARVACKAGAMTKKDRDDLVREASNNGALRTWADVERLAVDRVRRRAKRLRDVTNEPG